MYDLFREVGVKKISPDNFSVAEIRGQTSIFPYFLFLIIQRGKGELKNSPTYINLPIRFFRLPLLSLNDFDRCTLLTYAS
jgi:hypothetical protein